MLQLSIGNPNLNSFVKLDGHSCSWLNVEPCLVLLCVWRTHAVKLLSQDIRVLVEVGR